MKNREHEHDDIDEGSWAVSYADLLTVLIAFFVLFYSVDPVADERERLEAELFRALSENSALVTQEEETHSFFDEALTEKWPGQIHRIGSRIVVDFPGISFYDSGQVDLTPEGLSALERFIRVYMPYAGRHILSINAYTDQRPVRAGARRFRDNLELSALRAVAAMRALQISGIPLDRMVVGGYGEMQSAAQDLFDQLEDLKKEQIHDLSRRVVLVIKPEGERGL